MVLKKNYICGSISSEKTAILLVPDTKIYLELYDNKLYNPIIKYQVFLFNKSVK